MTSRSRKPNANPAAKFCIPTKWQWHLKTLLRLRAELQGKTRDHLTAAGALEKTDSGFGDRATDESEFENLISEVKSEANHLAEVDAALERLLAGTYGICLASHQPIPAERLRALPWTRFSVAHAPRART